MAQVAIITASDSGIGKECALLLAQQGFDIGITWHSDEEGAKDTAREVVSHGVRAEIVQLDLGNLPEGALALEKLIQRLGRIDVLVNNAGIQRRHPFTEFPEQEWNDVIAVNQTAVFLVSQAVTRHMVERKAGKVINICSMQSELGRDTITPYAASKGAVKMLTRGMCVELARHNIQVNGIAPGYFKTEMTKALVEDEAFTAWLCKRTPAARWGDPQELIGAAVFLSSKASDFVNGHLLFVDGGMLVAV
ncbi:MAG TPA: gluconate 5-dehydrogenase [Shigella sp.]|nr:gluconate 5-dehydrogenase [Shigella sp.]